MNAALNSGRTRLIDDLLNLLERQSLEYQQIARKGGIELL